MDMKQKFWAYDIDTYERCKKILLKMDELNNHNLNRKFWADRANEIAEKYPSAKLSRVETQK